MNKKEKMEEYIYFRRDNIAKEINNLSTKMKRLEYEKLECSGKMEEIQKNLDVGKNLFFVDKSDVTFVKKEISQLERRISEIDKEIALHELDWQNKMKEKYIVEDIISDLEKPESYETVTYDKFLISEEIYRKIANNIKEEVIQETTRALQKSQLCENVMDVDIMRAKLELKDIYQFLKNSIIKMRNFIYEITPVNIVDEDLEKSIINFITYIENQCDVHISFGRKGTTMKIENDIIWIIIRFMQCVIEVDSSIDINIILEYLEKKISVQLVCSKKDSVEETDVDFIKNKKINTINFNGIMDREKKTILDLKVIEEKIQSMNGDYDNNIKENEKEYIVVIPIENK